MQRMRNCFHELWCVTASRCHTWVAWMIYQRRQVQRIWEIAFHLQSNCGSFILSVPDSSRVKWQWQRQTQMSCLKQLPLVSVAEGPNEFWSLKETTWFSYCHWLSHEDVKLWQAGSQFGFSRGLNVASKGSKGDLEGSLRQPAQWVGAPTITSVRLVLFLGGSPDRRCINLPAPKLEDAFWDTLPGALCIVVI